MSFATLLIANRGEIAVRVARTARRMGLRTVAVHSTADAGTPHVNACDVAVEIGPPEAADSYLAIERIVDAARRTGAEAVHPGYGFLAESSAFARACEKAGLVFVGPRPDAIDAMGDKARAKRLMREAGVPVLEGYEGDEQSDARLLSEAERISFPLMVKAAAGGGGKGMRLVEDRASLADALAAARRESLASFGSDLLLLERAAVRPRHVEVQVLADSHGRTIHLGERDCSVQRRHQKVIEESPSPAVDAELRRRIGDAGVAAAEAVDYLGAGTVEFLLDERGEFFFLEMNTRLQVEHAVTEMIYGLDLVEWQLRIARGEALTLGPDDVRPSGHAIEARLYAEDPANDYLPSTGTVGRWEIPAGAGIRVDSGIEAGSRITPHYDPMIAKVIAHGADREEARLRLIAGLESTVALGTLTNRGMLLATLRDGAFAGGEATTDHLRDRRPRSPSPRTAEIAALAACRYDAARRGAAGRAPGLAGWSSSGSLGSAQRLRIGTSEHVVDVTEGRDGVAVGVDGVTHAIELGGEAPVVDGIVIPVRLLESEPGRVHAAFAAFDLEADDLRMLAGGRHEEAGEGLLQAPMHGKVIGIDVEDGESVHAGQRLLVLEAMKMEQEIVADVDGVATEIAALGAQVAAGEALARIEPSG